MKINKEVVENVAHLARLELKADEIDLYTEQLDRILAYMDKLNSLDTTGIEPTTHAIPLTNVFRQDVVDNNFQSEESVGNAPDRKGSFFKVPPIMEVD
jgi:aspartyl-tRNA(Asn)/glutamyl-tRNA(Gln) amidotransferase subunit C